VITVTNADDMLAPDLRSPISSDDGAAAGVTAPVSRALP
jgi:hypothetical protein